MSPSEEGNQGGLGDLQELFAHALSLSERERDVFLKRLAKERPDAARELEELLAEDEAHGALTQHPSRTTQPVPSANPPAPPNELLARLAECSPPASRYEIQGEFARGGMGAILKAHDQTLRRDLAMKVILGRRVAGPGSAPIVDPQTLGRFLDEAQVTGQLDHPGVVPVHELGLDQDGCVYFTMRLVRGRTLTEILRLVEREKEGWTRTRALNVILKVCETMSFAHSKDVIHRDLKPANIMVGRFGEVYVMDWGLAKLMGGEDRRDLRIQPQTSTAVQTARTDAAQETPESPIVTMDGAVVGTPSYMPPEQAEGRVEELGPRSDVYSIGAMLYQLLTGQAPYVRPGARMSPHTILAALVHGPPRRIHEIQSDVPAELEAICEKAMARDAADRYAGVADLAEDLTAYLEHRVVSAYRTGALVELRKWVERNRALAGALAAVLVLALGSFFTVLYVQAGRVREAQRVLRLAASRTLEELPRRARQLWPADPSRSDELRAWLADADALIASLERNVETREPGHREQLANLRGRATRLAGHERETARRSHGRFGDLAILSKELDELRRRHEATGDAELRKVLATDVRVLEVQLATLTAEVDAQEWSFTDQTDRWWHDQLSELVAGIQAFAVAEVGPIDGVTAAHGWGVRRRLRFAETIGERTVSGSEARAAWRAARASIVADPVYGGFELAPQLGLLPLGRDPVTGLWEFWHVLSGERPVRARTGGYVTTGATGIVLVLIPGGTFWMGAQKDDKAQRHYDSEAAKDEGPVHAVTVSPFFLSKYEMTQGQWMRFCGANPSSEGPDTQRSGGSFDSSHPVENVSWEECHQVMREMGLTLPSEAQWEYAARAGTDDPWWSGAVAANLATVANLADASAKPFVETWTCEAWDDGHVYHAPVGAYRANRFGLHDVHGNVLEWCLDGYDPEAYGDGRPRTDPLVDPRSSTQRIGRGGDYNDTSKLARITHRGSDRADFRSPRVGLRPARRVDASALDGVRLR